MNCVAFLALCSCLGARAKAPAVPSVLSNVADQDVDKRSQIGSKVAVVAREKAEWCRREYVSAKDCDEWVAGQLARRAARKADEKRRREERSADEEARRAARKADEERRREGQHAHEAGAPRDTTGKTAGDSKSLPESLMMLASLQGGKEKATAEGRKDGKAADPAKDKSEVCRKNYVNAKDCDEWVADQLARRAARKADEEKRREDRRADEVARRAARTAKPEGATGSPADRSQAAFLASAPAADSMGGFVLPATGGAFLAAAVSFLASVMIVRLRAVRIGEQPLLG